MWELDCEEGWVLKQWCFWTVVLEKTFDSPWDCMEIQPEHPKGNQSWIFIERTDVEAEAPILWLPDAKSWLIGKAPDAGKDWRQKEKRTVEDGMVRQIHCFHCFPIYLPWSDGTGCHDLSFLNVAFYAAFLLMKMWRSILSFNGTQSKETNSLHHVWIPYDPHWQPVSLLLHQHFAFNWVMHLLIRAFSHDWFFRKNAIFFPWKI